MSSDVLRVMHLISSLQVGGSEKLLVDFLASCRDDDRVNFTVVVMNQAVHPEMRQRLERLGVSVYFLDRPEGHQHPKYGWQLLQIIHRHRVQVIHSHNSGSKLWAMVCKLFTPSLKLVFTIHETQTLPRLSGFQLWLHRHWIDMHIAISKTVAGLCQQRHIWNFRQIYNGISLQAMRNDARVGLQSRCRLTPFSERALQIVHVGRMDYPVKGQDILVRAVHRCKQLGMHVQCTLMGGVYAYNQADFDDLNALVHTLDLQETVQFHLNQMDVAAQMARADLFVLPSRAEGLGLVVLEAMAAGLPVIASDTEGPRELVQHGVTGLLFANADPAHLAEQIQFIYEHPERADAMQGAASRWVLPFDIQEMKKQYYALYEFLIASPALAGIKQINVGRLTHETGV